MNKKPYPKTIFGFLRSKIIVNILIVICSVVFTIGTIEIITGGLISHKVTQFHKKIVSYHTLLTKSPWPIGAYRYHKTIGYELTPSFSGMVKKNRYFLKTHNLGYRIPKFEDSDSYEPGGILSYGCSFTFGSGVEAEETFSYLAAKHFNLPSYNYGVCSYSYASVILQLEELDKKGILKKLKPSIVILGAGNWLIRRSLSPFYPTKIFQFAYAYIGKQGNRLQIKQPDSFYSTKHLYSLVGGYFDGNNRKDKLTFGRYLKLLYIAPRVTKARLDKKFFKRPKISSRQLYDFVIGRILKILRKYDTRFVILWMPIVADQIDVNLAKSVKGFENILLVDGLKAIEKNNVDPKYYYKRHPRVEAHDAYAKALIIAMKESLK